MKSVHEIAGELSALGVVRGGVLLVHTSFRAVRPVENGPMGLIEALRMSLGKSGTLVMPTMTDGETEFDPRETSTAHMGITAETFWRQPGVLRSTHPGGSFAAIGPRAEEICAPQPLEPPHGPDSPPGRVHSLGGQVLLLGVSHEENTTLHVAEAIAQVRYSVRHPTLVREGDVVREILIAETDHCCRGFGQVDEWLRVRDRQREGLVGKAHARLCASRDIVTIATEMLAKDPFIFLCPRDSGCGECDAAWASVGNQLTH